MSGIRTPEGWVIEWLDEVDSTNEWLKRRVCRHGDVVVARHQTAGRGRRGTVWHAEPGENLTFSIFLEPPEPRGLWPRLALATGLALCEGLGRVGVEAGVKWPNDVWVRGRKLAGVLVEATSAGAVIGVGLNVQTTDFPSEIADIATSLAVEHGNQWNNHEVLEILLGPIQARCAEIGTDFKDLIESFQRRCVLTGNRVRLTSGVEPLTGVVRGVSDQGELLLDTPSGLRRLIQADEVRLIEP